MMAHKTIYIEEEIRQHKRVLAIIDLLKPSRVIGCDSYREVFNPRRQHFRLQKKNPALILATKQQRWLQPSPYGLGGRHNYYFSHMLNCIYDCSYCFLQGLFASAHHVVFINYEDFFHSIAMKMRQLKQQAFFFSGYDCDSLAYEPITQFVHNALPFFADQPQAILELRTKSVQIASLLKTPPIANCIVAFSLAPQSVVHRYEAKTPSLEKRLAAMKKLATRGWILGIRLDPIMWEEDWQKNYQVLIEQLATELPARSIHSITFGTMRFPRPIYDAMTRIYPTESFLVKDILVSDKQVGLRTELAAEMTAFCYAQLKKHFDSTKLFNQDEETKGN